MQISIIISCTHSDKEFCRKLGRTNAEYLTDAPVYGTNLNASLISKPITACTPSEASWITIDPVEYKGNHTEIRGEATYKNDAKVQGGVSNMFIYISEYETASVRLDLHADKCGDSKEFTFAGSCDIKLADCFSDAGGWHQESCSESGDITTHAECWVPVTLNSGFEGETEILVSLSVRRSQQIKTTLMAPCSFPTYCSTVFHGDSSAEKAEYALGKYLLEII